MDCIPLASEVSTPKNVRITVLFCQPLTIYKKKALYITIKMIA